MSLDTDGFDSLMTDIAGMANRMDADGAGAPVAKRILEAAAVPIYEQMKANASSDWRHRGGFLCGHTESAGGKVAVSAGLQRDA